MAKRKNNSVDRNREDKARFAIQEVFRTEPLTLDTAVERERQVRQNRISNLCLIVAGNSPEVDAIFARANANPKLGVDDIFPHANTNPKLALECEELLRELHAVEVRMRFPPSPQRDHLLKLLRRPAPPSKDVLYRGGIKERNFTIVKAVCLAITFAGLEPTRNRAQRDRDGAHLACSLVAEELKKLGFRRLGEDAIEKIWAQSVWNELRKMVSENNF
jgi:hypothetical protein